MTSPAARVLAGLGSTVPLYAAVDGARDCRIEGWFRDARAPAWCLYRGHLSEELRRAAPSLVRLCRGHDYTERFFRVGFGDAWGIVLASAAPQAELRRHLRRFLRVRTEDGRILAFRYYDPRVLRLYLPTCTPAEIAAFFGPISAIAAEAAQPGWIHFFRPGPGGLEARLVGPDPEGPAGRAGASECR